MMGWALLPRYAMQLSFPVDPFVVPNCGWGLILLLLNVHCSSVDPVANRKFSGRPAICNSVVAFCHQVIQHLFVGGLPEWKVSGK